jgi:hypothetical protein
MRANKKRVGQAYALFAFSLLDREKFAELIFVETNDKLVVHRDDGNAHLAALLYHLLTLRKVGGDIVIREFHVVLGKEILSRMAKVARRR